MKNGFTIVEAIVGLFLVSMISMGVVYISSSANQQDSAQKTLTLLSQKRADFQNLLNSDTAWAQTVSRNSAGSNLSCLTSPAGCLSQVNASTDFNLYDTSGNLFYNSGPENGFNLDGSQCIGTTEKACAIKFRLTWTATCETSVDVKCNRPLIKVSGAYDSKTIIAGTAFNAQKYGFSVYRQAASTLACTGTLPPCASGVIACLSNNWTCVTPPPPFCAGPVTWHDDNVSDPSICSAVIPGTTNGPTGVKHDTLSGLISTLASANPAGHATFICVPGMPNNGFVQQTGATCVASINGVCGTALTFPSAAAADAATSSDLCTAGTPLPVTLTGAGPHWSWKCQGSGPGGTTASCSANLALIDGVCGPAMTSGKSYPDLASATAAGLCNSPSTPTPPTGSGPWNWTCPPISPGIAASCSAKFTAAKVNGSCGKADGGTYPQASAVNLAGTCNSGTIAIPLTDPGPWGWTCNGANGGTSDTSCHATNGGNFTWTRESCIDIVGLNVAMIYCHNNCGVKPKAGAPCPTMGQRVFCGNEIFFCD